METQQFQPQPSASTGASNSAPGVQSVASSAPQTAANATQGSNTGHDQDLYAAITAEDTPVVVEKEKKHVSPMMAMVIKFMKLTFWMDLTRRSNESTFHTIAFVWHAFMAMLYICGGVTLFLCLTSFVHLPLKLETFFNQHDVKFDKLEMADYSLTQIDIENLHDEKNTYQIPNVRIHSTFGDFLKNKILSVEAEGVKINLDSKQSKQNELAWLVELFSSFNKQNAQTMDINSITISNAVLTILGKNITLPIAFSLTGDYSQKAQTAILFNINESFLKMQGNLSISGEGQKRKLEMTISSGTLSLPNQQEEELDGTINIDVNGQKIQAIAAEINFTYAHTEKKLILEMEKSADEGFDGTLDFTIKNTANQQKGEETLVDLSLDFTNLLMDENKNVSTQSPLKLTIKHLNQNNMVLENVTSTLNGKLFCSVSDGKCEFNLTEKSDLKLNSMSLSFKDQKIILNDIQSLKLLPNAQKTCVADLNAFNINLNTEGVDAYGFINEQKKSVELVSKKMHLSGVFSHDQTPSSLSVQIENADLTTPSLTLNQLNLSSDNIFSDTSPIQLTSTKATTKSPLLKKPFSVALKSLNRQTIVQLKVENTNINLLGKGTLDPFQGTFVGEFSLSPFQVDELLFTLNELTTLLPEGIENISGQITAAGKIKYYSSENISGPMYLGLKNVKFDVNKMTYSNLNSVIGLQSLLPIVSAASQTFFIENIKGLIPLSDVKGTFQLNNQTFRLYNLNAKVANQEMFLSSTIIPFEKPNTSVSLKTTENFDASEIDSYINLDGLKLNGGSLSLSLPINISEKGIDFASLSMKLNNVNFMADNSGHVDTLNLLAPEDSGYYARSGLMTLNADNTLQVELDGWAVPQKTKKSFSKKDIHLSGSFIDGTSQYAVPQDIWKKLNTLFERGKKK